MENSTFEICNDELDIKFLLLSIVSKWRKIIAWMLICGTLIGSIILFKNLSSLEDDEEIQKQIETRQTLTDYLNQQQVSVSDHIEALSKQIDEQKEYLDNSLYMKIDPYAIYSIELRYYIKTDYKIMPSMDYQDVDRTGSVVNAFVTLLTNKDNLQILADQQNTELKYIQELISIWNAGDGILALNIIGDSNDRVCQIRDYLVNSIDENKNFIRELITNFEITEISSSTYCADNSALLETQTQKKQILENYYSEFENGQNKLKELKATVIGDDILTLNRSLKKAIKATILGAAVGSIGAIGVFALTFVFSNTIYSVNTLKDKMAVPIIGSRALPHSKSLTKFDCWIRNAEERSTDTCMETACMIIAAYAENVLGPNSRVIISGQLSDDLIQSIVTSVAASSKTISVLDGGQMLSTPDAILNLGQADGVILIEQAGLSKYSLLKREIEVIDHFGKKLVGCFVLEN